MSDDALDLIVKLLNRDPKQRLGSGPGDSEEIKAHQFFKNINWDDVFQRKLKPPKPYVKPIIEKKIALDIFNDSESNEEDRMNKWNFIGKDFN